MVGSVEVEFRWVSTPEGHRGGDPSDGGTVCAGEAELCLRFCRVMPARCWGGRLPAGNLQGIPEELCDTAATSQLHSCRKICSLFTVI